MKRTAIVVLALAAFIATTAPSAHAVGVFPTQYQCKLVPDYHYEYGLAGSSYVNDVSAYGIAWKADSVNIHLSGPSCGNGTETIAWTMVLNVTMIRTFYGGSTVCANHSGVLHGNVSRVTDSMYTPVGQNGVCGIAGWPAGYSRIYFTAKWGTQFQGPYSQSWSYTS